MCAPSSGKFADHVLTAPCPGGEVSKLTEIPSFAAGAAGNPLSGAKFRSAGIPNTFSLAWRLGRVVRRAQVESKLGTVVDALIEEAGGPAAARRVFTGKVRGVETRITETGHSLGEVVIERLGDDEVETVTDRGEDSWTEVRVPFMNENLAVVAKGGGSSQEQVSCLEKWTLSTPLSSLEVSM